MPKELDARERLFVREYLACLDPKKAAIAAGYAKSTARVKSHMWVGSSRLKPHVYNAVRKAEKKLEEKADISLERTVKEIASLAYHEVDDVIKPSDKLTALDKLMRHHGGYNDKLTLDGGVDVVRIVDRVVPSKR